jgi:hypothetical protein
MVSIKEALEEIRRLSGDETLTGVKPPRKLTESIGNSLWADFAYALQQYVEQLAYDLVDEPALKGWSVKDTSGGPMNHMQARVELRGSDDKAKIKLSFGIVQDLQVAVQILWWSSGSAGAGDKVAKYEDKLDITYDSFQSREVTARELAAKIGKSWLSK